MIKKLINQTYCWDKESARYTSENIKRRRLDDYSNEFKFFNNKNIKSILDVGCGSGEMLKDLTVKLNNKKNKIINATGLEPSREASRILKRKYKDDKNLSFINSYAHALPFNDNSFDLVYAWSVLHWIDRNNYLQSIGEMIRVTKKYLVIMDFYSGKDYRVNYSHNKDFYTYKSDFDVILKHSGVMMKQTDLIWRLDPEDNFSKKFISKKELRSMSNNFSNKFNWDARRFVIYKKDTNLLKTVKNQAFFKK
tara:strand:+ start:533 stop:1285 length:753 start_codon:yes stop_codon:yes gene_type:complete